MHLLVLGSYTISVTARNTISSLNVTFPGHIHVLMPLHTLIVPSPQPARVDQPVEIIASVPDEEIGNITFTFTDLDDLANENALVFTGSIDNNSIHFLYFNLF